MTLKEAVEQLKDLRRNQESFLDGKYNEGLDKGDPELQNNPFVRDMQAIDKALEIIDDIKQYKRLLLASIIDMKDLENEEINFCDKCSKANDKEKCNNSEDCFEWEHKDEAMQLILKN